MHGATRLVPIQLPRCGFRQQVSASVRLLIFVVDGCLCPWRNRREIVRSKDGTPIAYWHSGKGAPLVLVHGATVDHRMWTPVLAALERHFSVYAIDRRGRGHSGDADAYALAREGEDIAAVLDAIGGTVHVMGHSFGCICALEAALLTPNIDRLILYELPLPLGRRDGSAAFDARLQALLEAGHPAEALVLFLHDIVELSSQQIAAMQARPTWPGWVAAAHTIPRELQSIYAFDPVRFRTLRTPTLLLLGGDSPPLRRTSAEALNAALPKSQMVVLPGSQHSAMRTASDVFVQEVAKFFTTATAG